jgi:hypothetical protein
MRIYYLQLLQAAEPATLLLVDRGVEGKRQAEQGLLGVGASLATAQSMSQHGILHTHIPIITTDMHKHCVLPYTAEL